MYMLFEKNKKLPCFFIQPCKPWKKNTATASPTKGGDIPTTYSTRSLWFEAVPVRRTERRERKSPRCFFSP